MNSNVKYQTKRIHETILGGTIMNVMKSGDGESFGFYVNKGKESFEVWIDCDPEGNGAGWLSISNPDESS